jgi:hypothetical protein
MVLNSNVMSFIFLIIPILYHLGFEADTIENGEALVDKFYVDPSATRVSSTNNYRAKLNELCRVCGISSDVKFDIFGPEGCKRQLLEKIHKHLPIVVTQNDKLPLQVCDVCVMHLDICHKLVQCCADTDKNLNHMLSKEDLEESTKTLETGLECLNHPELVITRIAKSSATKATHKKLIKVNINA